MGVTNLTPEQRRLLFECIPEATQLADGSWRVAMGGHVGVGRTQKEADDEAAEKICRALVGEEIRRVQG